MEKESKNRAKHFYSFGAAFAKEKKMANKDDQDDVKQECRDGK